MNQAEIIAMAKEAGFGMQMALLDHPYCQADAQRLYQQLERFAALVHQKTVQEISANAAEKGITFCMDRTCSAIRARGQKEAA